MRRAWRNWRRRPGGTRLDQLRALAALSLFVVVAGMGCGGRSTPMPDVPATIQVSSSSPDATVQELSASARTAAGEPFAAGPAGLARPADARVVTLSGTPGFGGATAQGGQRSTSAAYATDESPTVEELLEDGLHLAGASPVHLAIRGTPAAASVRCAWRGVVRTAQQREGAIRFWLQLESTEAISNVATPELLFNAVLDTLNPDYRETAKASFRAIARGGESMEYLFLTCFADYAVTNFLLGSGTTPTTVTVAYDRRGEAASYDLYVHEHDTGTYGTDALQTRGEYETALQAQVVAAEDALRTEIGGREAVVFLAPMGAHNAIAFEAWQAGGRSERRALVLGVKG